MPFSILEQIDKQIALTQFLLDLSYKQQTAISANRMDKFVELGVEKEKLIEELQHLESSSDSYRQLSSERYESLSPADQEEIDQCFFRLERLLHQVEVVNVANHNQVSKKVQSIKVQLGGLKMGTVVRQTYGSQEVDRRFPEGDRQPIYIDRKN